MQLGFGLHRSNTNRLCGMKLETNEKEKAKKRRACERDRTKVDAGWPVIYDISKSISRAFEGFVLLQSAELKFGSAPTDDSAKIVICRWQHAQSTVISIQLRSKCLPSIAGCVLEVTGESGPIRFDFFHALITPVFASTPLLL